MRRVVVALALVIAVISGDQAWAAITLCGTAQKAFNGAVGASLSVNGPASCSSGSTATIVFIFGEYYNVPATLNTPTATGGSGCGSVTGISLNPVVAGLTDGYVWYQMCTSGIPTSYSVSPSTTGGQLSLATWAFQGHNTSTPIDATPTTTNATSAAATITAPTLTTTVNNDAIMNLYYVLGSAIDVGTGASFSYSTGTEIIAITRSDTAASGNAGIAWWTKTPAGATSSQTYSWTGGNNVGTSNIPRVGITVDLEPSGGGPTPTPTPTGFWFKP